VSELTLVVDGKYESPYALSAFVALEEKGLPYALKTVTLPIALNRPDWFRSPHGKVPALQHGGYWLSESSAIAEYLAETFPFPKHPRLFPENLQQRGICRLVQAWVRSDFMPIRQERSTETVFFKRRATAPLSEHAKKDAARLFAAVDPLVAEGRTTLFESWCIADVDLAMMLQRLVFNGDEVPKKLRAYAEANFARPSVQKWLQLARPAS
jgi:glutathione S-transferase